MIFISKKLIFYSGWLSITNDDQVRLTRGGLLASRSFPARRHAMRPARDDKPWIAADRLKVYLGHAWWARTREIGGAAAKCLTYGLTRSCRQPIG